eukprot:1158274-Pelagomonas_calceolata.AAC.49
MTQLWSREPGKQATRAALCLLRPPCADQSPSDKAQVQGALSHVCKQTELPWLYPANRSCGLVSKSRVAAHTCGIRQLTQQRVLQVLQQGLVITHLLHEALT